MPQLLISVRDVRELQLCQRLGVELIDLKEPRAGALEPTSAVLWQWGAEQALRSQNFQLSLALGELRERCCDSKEMAAWMMRLPRSGVSFAKLGWSGLSLKSGGEMWLSWREHLPAGIEPVIVAYADHQRCQAPEPIELARWGARQGATIVLLDTFDKRFGPVWKSMSADRLLEFSNELRNLGMKWALAGSLQLADLERLAELNPEIVAVRGGACESDRESELSADKIAAWQTGLQSRPAPPHQTSALKSTHSSSNETQVPRVGS